MQEVLNNSLHLFILPAPPLSPDLCRHTKRGHCILDDLQKDSDVRQESFLPAVALKSKAELSSWLVLTLRMSRPLIPCPQLPHQLFLKNFLTNDVLNTPLSVLGLLLWQPAMRETWVQSLGWEDPLEKVRLPTPVFWLREVRGLYSPCFAWTWLSDFHFHLF